MLLLPIADGEAKRKLWSHQRLESTLVFHRSTIQTCDMSGTHLIVSKGLRVGSFASNCVPAVGHGTRLLATNRWRNAFIRLVAGDVGVFTCGCTIQTCDMSGNIFDCLQRASRGLICLQLCARRRSWYPLACQLFVGGTIYT